jgi:antibiotic biosynthesis monooxygenase
MVRLYIRHRVADYDAWRSAYDDFAGRQQAGGVRAEAVYQSIDDPNDVTVWHDFDDAEAARAFVGSAELRDGMRSAGVQGEPQMWFTQER